jgi:hypothetical protein
MRKPFARTAAEKGRVAEAEFEMNWGARGVAADAHATHASNARAESREVMDDWW